MSGQTVSEQLKQFQKKLDEYEREVGLPLIQLGNTNEVEKILQVTRRDLQKLGPQEREEYAFILRQFSFHLQRKTNVEQSVVLTCDETIKRRYAPLIAKSRGYSYEERVLSVLHDDEIFQVVSQIRAYAKARLERLAFLSPKIDGLANTLSNMRSYA